VPLCMSQVVPLHSYKYISAVQDIVGRHPLQRAPLLIRIEEKAGHGAGMPLSKRIVEQADMLAFLGLALNAPSDFAQQHASAAAPAAAAQQGASACASAGAAAKQE
jgi:hypothetical protein